MFSGAYPRESWYVAGRSEDIVRALRPLRLFGEEIVIFRRGDGTPAALEDACPHRRLRLSKGALEGDNVVCGYHGLTFDGSGACVAAPTQADAIPKRARVRSYPLVERYGFVWIWPGDPERSDPDAIIDIPHFDDPAWGRTDRGALDIDCNYLWVTDNLLDPSHVAWVHVTSFAGAGTDDAPLPGDAFINISYNFMTPEDDDRTLYFWFQHCNSFPEDEAMSERMFAGAVMAFNEDKEVLEDVARGMKASKAPPLNLGLDAGAMRFRRIVERRVAAERG